MGITAAGATALAIGASGALSAGASLYGSSQAAGAADKAAGLSQQQLQNQQGLIQPYALMGWNALQPLQAAANAGTTGGGPDYVGLAYQNLPGQMTQAQLEQTPGYQFDLSQGQKAVQSAAAARGLGVSGASLKGAANFATGLANKTYLDQFNVAQKRFEDYGALNTAQQGNLTNQFNRLKGIADLGENAIVGSGATGAALTNQAGNYINQSGLATAAGTTGVSNALTGSVNNYLAYNQMQNLINRSPGTGGYAIDTPGQNLAG